MQSFAPDTTTGPPLTVRVTRPDDGVRVVSVFGEIDLATAPLLSGALVADADAPLHRQIIDLTRVTFFGSSGISALLGAREFAQDRGHALHLVGVCGNAVVTRVLQLTSLAPLFVIDESVDAALGRAAPPAA